MPTAVPYVDVKRFAVHDGPGIRTTLFLKGCSLHCIWCHNPESRNHFPELGFHEPKCLLCGECAKVCPCHTIEEGKHHLDRARCKSCGKCAEACPAGALELFGKTITAEQAVEKLLEDRIFYGDDGGVTLSGGEPLLYPEFCREVFLQMQQEKIRCALDTCGNVPWSAFERVLPFTDLFLYDFKCADSAKHKILTGCGNERILENLKHLDECKKEIEIRMIMVPGHNMAKEDLERAGAFLSPLRTVFAVRLLAYHSLARSKFSAVGHPDTMPDVPSPNAAALDAAAEILQNYGLKVINSLRN